MADHIEEPAAFITRLMHFREMNNARDVVIHDLVKAFDELYYRERDLRSDIENERRSRRTWQEKAQVLHDELTRHKLDKESNPMIHIILDGDGAIFKESFMARGEEGGAEAAQELHQRIMDGIQKMHPDVNVDHWTLLVHVFVNLEGLSRAVVRSGLVPSNTLPAFTRGFGRARPLFNFVDVGDGKEEADHKVREMLRHVLNIRQCRYVFFGPCHDNGYIPFLQQYSNDPLGLGKLILIETTPATAPFTQLKFRRHRLSTIFRESDLPVHLMSPPTKTETLAVRTNRPMTPTATPPTLNATATSWAAAAGRVGDTKVIDITSTPKRASAVRYYLLNRYDERVDEPLPRSDPRAEQTFREKTGQSNFCNDHHISGRCLKGITCTYQHGERLPPAELNVLRHKVRGLRCMSGSDCRSFDCPCGHQCKYGGKDCVYDECRFADLHHVEPTPTRKIYEDGMVDHLAVE